MSEYMALIDHLLSFIASLLGFEIVDRSQGSRVEKKEIDRLKNNKTE